MLSDYDVVLDVSVKNLCVEIELLILMNSVMVRFDYLAENPVRR